MIEQRCKLCKGRNKKSGNRRNIDILTLQGVVCLVVEQLKCVKCGKYSSEDHGMSPANSSTGWDIIEFIVLNSHEVKIDAVKSKLFTKHGVILAYNTIDRLNKKWRSKYVS